MLAPWVARPEPVPASAYQGNETRQLALALGFTPVVPPLRTRVDLWEYDREMYKRRRNREVVLFRRIFSRFEPTRSSGFILFASDALD